MSVEVIAMVVVDAPPNDYDKERNRRFRRMSAIAKEIHDCFHTHDEVISLGEEIINLAVISGVELDQIDSAPNWHAVVDLAKDRDSMETASDPSYHVCRCRLVQPVGRKGSVPVPKWECDTLFSMQYDQYERTRRRTDHEEQRITYNEWQEKGWYDAFGDVTCSDTGAGLRVRVPNYKDQWIVTGYWKRVPLLVTCKDAHTLPWLPFGHPIVDRRLQLRQIRFLYPETRTMPMSIAADYVRDRM